MPAKIIPFPRFMQRHLALQRGRHTAQASEQTRSWEAPEGLSLVATGVPERQGIKTEVRRESQGNAIRIVREVQQEWNERQCGARANGERPQVFWATLPMPKPQRETPFSVARRLMHMLLSDAKTA